MAVATELVVAMRALRMRGVAPSAGDVCALYAAAAERLGDDLGDRTLSDDIEAARELLLA